MDFAMATHVLLLKNAKGVFPIEVYLREFTIHCVILVLFRVFLCSLKRRLYERLTYETTLFRCFREVRSSYVALISGLVTIPRWPKIKSIGCA